MGNRTISTISSQIYENPLAIFVIVPTQAQQAMEARLRIDVFTDFIL
jgi:hypothetical protein